MWMSGAPHDLIGFCVANDQGVLQEHDCVGRSYAINLAAGQLDLEWLKRPLLDESAKCVGVHVVIISQIGAGVK
jgi:hypothetical protein